ncbi:DUF4191 domain-containing protein [Brevibacterium yomogidense]|uniref:Transmembrane protein MT2276, clustered with lipoate protein n=1 Tax=Brevibacterium yomogidense TaxID=946573 RepID=A0A1X6XCB1_9MICO|nr:DUF4191 domain-containing protein [Brevibacterium yomogidense]SLM96845.1 Transmembrane protein MT2276, clustered with lipoate gene [Brevibacterium yomogidense]
MSTNSETPRKGLFGRKKKDRAPKKNGRIQQMREVFNLARKHNPASAWLMAAALVGLTLVGVLVGLLVSGGVFGTILWGISGLLAGAVLAMFMLGRYAETAAFDQMRGQAGAIGAVLNTARRGWLMDEQPIAVDPRTQEMVFRTTGRAGVVLVGEGRSRHKVTQLLEKQKRRHEKVVKGVPVHTFQGGENEGQVPMENLTKTLYKLPKRLNKAEILAVRNRLTGIGSLATRPPIPKGVDPNNIRPDRRALRGR